MEWLGFGLLGLIVLGVLWDLVLRLKPKSDAEVAAENALASAFSAFVEETRPLAPTATMYPQAALYRHAWRRAAMLAVIAAESKSDADVERFKSFQELARKEYYAVAPTGPFGKVRLVLSDGSGARLRQSELERIAARARPAKDTTGVVYLLKSGLYYKVGRTADMDRRFKEMRQQLPDPVTVEHTIHTNDPVEIERLWHSRFASKRKRGEWFRLTDEDVAEFKKHTRM